MKNQFQYNEGVTPAPIIIEQVVAEVPGGGILVDAGYDVMQSTPVGRTSEGKYQVIKCAKVKTKYTTGTSLEVEKGSGIAKSDFIAFGGMAVQVSAINTSNPDKDVLTIGALTGKTIEVGDFVYQAAKAATGADAENMAEPVIKPIGIVDDGHFTATNGVVAFAGKGDTPVRVILAGVVRGATCKFGAEIEAMIPSIHRV